MTRHIGIIWLIALALLATLLGTATAVLAASGTTERVSVDSTGSPANDLSADAAISADGRFVAFISFASNLVPDDTNACQGYTDGRCPDIFVRDRQTGTTERISVDSGGGQANGHSSLAALSADGHIVAFESLATNLVAGDSNSQPDIFVRDRQTGTTERVSISSAGEQANNSSSGAALSADGRFVAFQSWASNLVPGDTNSQPDIFVRDRQSGTTERVSVNSANAQAYLGSDVTLALSADGRFVVFVSPASNLVAGDTNGMRDIFVRDRQTNTTERVSVSSTGAQANNSSMSPTISADGQVVAFLSNASNLVAGDTNNNADVFVYDRQSGTTTRVSISSAGEQANLSSFYSPALSADGRFVAFTSQASNLVAGDTNGVNDIFVHDRQSGTTERVSVSSAGGQANGPSDRPDLSADGCVVAFQSLASNLVEPTGAGGIFVHT